LKFEGEGSVDVQLEIEFQRHSEQFLKKEDRFLNHRFAAEGFAPVALLYERRNNCGALQVIHVHTLSSI
jgi:hypothetical protein